eukprot:30711-Pelagococcus_subviridis.AAC.3
MSRARTTRRAREDAGGGGAARLRLNAASFFHDGAKGRAHLSVAAGAPALAAAAAAARSVPHVFVLARHRTRARAVPSARVVECPRSPAPRFVTCAPASFVCTFRGVVQNSRKRLRERRARGSRHRASLEP